MRRDGLSPPAVVQYFFVGQVCSLDGAEKEWPRLSSTGPCPSRLEATATAESSCRPDSISISSIVCV